MGTGVDDQLQGDTLWELGAPANLVPPSGSNCFGTNLTSDYETNADVWLRSPPIDLTNPALTGASLCFKQFRDIELTFDSGSIRVVDAVTNATLGDEVYQTEGTSVDWEDVKADLPAEALGKSIKLEFRFSSDEFGQQAGWFIDDVAVRVR